MENEERKQTTDGTDDTDKKTQRRRGLQLSDEEKRFIDERLEDHRQNPNAGSPWPEARARIIGRKK